MKTSSLGTRIVTSLVVAPIVLALVWIPGLHWAFTAFIGTITAFAAYEYCNLTGIRRNRPVFWVSVAAVPVLAMSGGFGAPNLLHGLLVGVLIAVTTVLMLRNETTVATLTASIFGVLYVGWLPAHLALTHGIVPGGLGLVTLLLLVVPFTDTGAYFVGRNFGKHKFSPVISPNKTWEGAIGGFIVAVLAAVLIGLAVRENRWDTFPHWTVLRYGLTGAALSTAAQLGDLVESSIKRGAGMKDSGWLFPGHGGALDRCDGFLFAAPVLYYISLL